MSSSKVSATGAAGAISVPTRVATGSVFTSIDRIEGVSAGPSVGFSGYWRKRFDEDAAQGNFDGYRQGQEQLQPQFTPLVARRAAAFPASLTFSDSLHASAFFGSDMLRAVSLYDFNMKLFARSYAAQGSVINRFS